MELLPSLDREDSLQALVIGGERLSYAELSRLCRAHAHHLLAGGVAPGDRVAVWAQPSIPTVVAMVGNALAGVVSVPLNPALGATELAHILADAGPRKLLGEAPRTGAGVESPSEAIRADGPGVGTLPTPAPDDPLLVLYTSGTTGPPKGAVLTHGNAASNLDALAAAWEWTADDHLVHALPIFHVHGLILGIFGALRVGGSVELLPRFEPERIASAFEAGGATMLFGVPTMYHRLADAMEADAALAHPLAKARLLISGSAALPVREHQRVERLVGQRVVERYGLTETLINCSMRAGGDRRHGTVGTPLDGVELRLVDEEGREAGPGAMGEVWVRGPNVFAGYLGRPDATREAMTEEGFFRTGDLAVADPDGFVRIVGRMSTDLIKTGGFKVGAGEVEAALLEHPAVAEAAVVGVPDDDLGERIVAYVVPRPGEAPSQAALADHVAHHLAPHKRPREAHLVESLPRNAMGKVLKRRLG